MSKYSTLGVLSFQSCSQWAWHHSLSQQARPWGKERANNFDTHWGPDSPSLYASFLCHCNSVKNCVNQACDFYHESRWLFISTKKIKYGVYSYASATVEENSESCLQIRSEAIDLSPVQSHHVAEDSGGWMCPKDCTGDFTESAFIPLLSSFSITFLPTLSKATDFVYQEQADGHSSPYGNGSTTAEKWLFFHFFPLVTSHHTLGCLQGPPLSCRADYDLHSCQKHKKYPQPSQGNKEWTWQISMNLMCPHHQGCNRDTESQGQ